MKERVVQSSTMTATNDFRKTLRLSTITTIDYEIENRPHAPGLPGGVMGGLFCAVISEIFEVFSPPADRRHCWRSW